MKLSTAEKAKKLLKLFGPRGGCWTQDTMGLTKSGKYTTATDKNAVRWCLIGGCKKLKFSHKFLNKELERRELRPDAIAFNDSNPFTAVRKFLKELTA
jgi:hypothetical protein